MGDEASMTNSIVEQFSQNLGKSWTPKPEQRYILEKLIIHALRANQSIDLSFAESVFLEAVNQKLDINRKNYQIILDLAYSYGIKLNYNKKVRIRKALDSNDYYSFKSILNEEGNQVLFSSFSAATPEETRSVLEQILGNDEKASDIIDAIFARFCYNLIGEEIASDFFSGGEKYTDDFLLSLYEKYKDLGDRSNALTFIDIPESIFLDNYDNGCNQVLGAVEEAYNQLNNYCALVVYIPPFNRSKTYSIQWRLYKDIVLFAEKFIETPIEKPYFRWQEIKKSTTDYISSLRTKPIEWNKAHQGFVYKDCFILKESDEDTEYSILLVFDKNKRDERPINCPACRSVNVQGNSYPILNVKSWECKNPLCPERSKYNRGKRFSFVSLYRQRIMLDEENRIPQKSVTLWHRDLVLRKGCTGAFEMCMRHFSCKGDNVVVYTSRDDKSFFSPSVDRNICYKTFAINKPYLRQAFLSCSYFSRYIQDNPLTSSSHIFKKRIQKAVVYLGDSLNVLRSLRENTIQCAVTSPPYYNAKEYSQWPNIYCFLYDMYNIAKEVYRVMETGGVYLFNIFDYFDNEKNVVLSAMGNKRMILGAYLLDIFERIGFNIIGNIIWDKGEIQGNRGFNQGNMTPYYQTPNNCWEHIFVVSKGTPARHYASLKSKIVNIHPVVKMIRGKNVLGHTAPYPKAIPAILADVALPTDCILDPFLGSGTTCIVANDRHISSIGIEKDEKYFNLCCQLLQESSLQLL